MSTKDGKADGSRCVRIVMSMSSSNYTSLFRLAKLIRRYWLSLLGEDVFSESSFYAQEIWREYKARRNLADCAIVAEELWFVVLLFKNWILILCLYYNYWSGHVIYVGRTSWILQLSKGVLCHSSIWRNQKVLYSGI